ncbi:hypothetical protein Ancab_016830 [Ancistrocladus abbreviatus]
MLPDSSKRSLQEKITKLASNMEGRYGLGLAIRDHKAKVHACGVKRLSPSCENAIAEAMALSFGL